MCSSVHGKAWCYPFTLFGSILYVTHPIGPADVPCIIY